MNNISIIVLISLGFVGYVMTIVGLIIGHSELYFILVYVFYVWIVIISACENIHNGGGTKCILIAIAHMICTGFGIYAFILYVDRYSLSNWITVFLGCGQGLFLSAFVLFIYVSINEFCQKKCPGKERPRLRQAGSRDGRSNDNSGFELRTLSTIGGSNTNHTASVTSNELGLNNNSYSAVNSTSASSTTVSPSRDTESVPNISIETPCNGSKKEVEKTAVSIISTSDLHMYDETTLQKRLRELEDAARCPICMERHKDRVFQCGHSTCAACADQLANCPICREVITQRINLF